MSVTISLAGTFDLSDFSEVVGLLARRSATGRLHVRGQSLNASIRLSNGNAVGIDVVIAGIRDGRKDVRGRIEEVLFQALRSARGSFEFQPTDSVEVSVDRAVRLMTVLAAAERRLEAWKEVESAVPTLGAVPRIAEGLRSVSMTVDQEQWRIVASIDGRRTVGGISRRLDIEPLRLCQLLKPLVDDGAVAMVTRNARTRIDAAPDGLTIATTPDPAERVEIWGREPVVPTMLVDEPEPGLVGRAFRVLNRTSGPGADPVAT